jgi:hypothetical protein
VRLFCKRIIAVEVGLGTIILPFNVAHFGPAVDCAGSTGSSAADGVGGSSGFGRDTGWQFFRLLRTAFAAGYEAAAPLGGASHVPLQFSGGFDLFVEKWLLGQFLARNARPMGVARKRGRPLKFGRPARTLAVTLPDDVITALRTFDPDIGRAIVALVGSRQCAPAAVPAARSTVDVARTGRRQSVIVVDPKSMPALPGCSLMQISGDRAFIALEPGAGLADLEVAVIDHLAQPQLTTTQRAGLLALRRALRKWRTDSRVTVFERAIVVLEGDPLAMRSS